MSSMRAGNDVNVTLSAGGEEALDELAAAMAATYDGSPESLDRLMRCLNTADVDDLARDLSAAGSGLEPVDDVARRRLEAEEARTLPEVRAADRPLPSPDR